MIYFPYPSIADSYNCLSSKDKKHQLEMANYALKVIKTKQLVHQVGNGSKVGTIVHARDPVILMFQPYESFLILYINTVTMLEGKMPNLKFPSVIKEPDWFKDEKLHNSHRKLLFKNDAMHYCQFKWFSSVDDQKFFNAETKQYWPIKWDNVLLQGAG